MWNHLKVEFTGSFERAAIAAARVIPGLLTMLVLLVLALTLAVAVRVLLRRGLTRIGFDRSLRRWGFQTGDHWMPEASPTALAERFGFWTVLISGALIGLQAFDPTSAVAARALAYVPQVVLAIVLVVAGIAASRFLERAVLISAVNMEIQSARLLALGVKWLVLVFATAMALENLGVGGPILTIFFATLFGGIVLALALAFGLGSRDAVSKSWEKRMERRRRPASDEVHHL